jgi:hypothetical protein
MVVIVEIMLLQTGTYIIPRYVVGIHVVHSLLNILFFPLSFLTRIPIMMDMPSFRLVKKDQSFMIVVALVKQTNV